MAKSGKGKGVGKSKVISSKTGGGVQGGKGHMFGKQTVKAATKE